MVSFAHRSHTNLQFVRGRVPAGLCRSCDGFFWCGCRPTFDGFGTVLTMSNAEKGADPMVSGRACTAAAAEIFKVCLLMRARSQAALRWWLSLAYGDTDIVSREGLVRHDMQSLKPRDKHPFEEDLLSN
eukprot:5459524-Amphidinium_carterae.1